MAKTKNLTFTITIGNISHTFTYYPQRSVFRVTLHHKLLNETKYKEFLEPFLNDSRGECPYLKARIFFQDVLDSHLRVLFAPIENKYYELPF